MAKPTQEGLSEDFTSALEASPTGMLVVASCGTIQFANAHAQAMFRQPDLAGIGVDVLVPTEVASHHAGLRRNYLTHAPARRTMGAGRDLMARRADGSLFPVEIGLNPFEHRGQKLTICSVIDITARRALEHERQQSHAAVLEAQRLDSLGLLAGGVAHDFNNLLVSVLGNAKLAADSPQLAPDCLHDIVLAAQQAADLSRQMLAYSGKGKFRVERLELSQLVVDAKPLLQSLLRRRGDLRLHCVTDLPAIEGDAAQLKQVLMNLVGNAGDALPQNGGTVHVTTGIVDADSGYLRQFTPKTLQPGPYVTLEVSDTGSGIAADLLPRLFEPFVTTKPAGHGLGLAATLGIVRGHGGAIHVYTDEGRGTTFKVLFPPKAAVALPNAPPSNAVDKARPVVMLVEDDALVRRFASRCLEHAGFRVLQAEDGHDAVEIYATCQDRVRAIILDVTMPRMSGPEAFRELRRIREDVPVIVTSGFAREETMASFAGRKVIDCLPKPYTSDQLIELVKRAVDEG